VQPPGRPVPFSTSFGKANALSGGRQVVAVAGMIGSIMNHVFGNALVNPCASVQVLGSAARLTSLCFRHVYACPDWSTWVVWAAVAFARPLTPSQPP